MIQSDILKSDCDKIARRTYYRLIKLSYCLKCMRQCSESEAVK